MPAKKVKYTLATGRFCNGSIAVNRVRTTHIYKLRRSLHEIRRFFRVRRFEANFSASYLSAAFVRSVDIAVYLHRPCFVVVVVYNDNVSDLEVDNLIEGLLNPCK